MIDMRGSRTRETSSEAATFLSKLTGDKSLAWNIIVAD